VVNTFTMIIGQRMRELGLLRAVGGDRRQIFTLVTAEAVFIGAVASVLGLLAGVTLATVVGDLINSDDPRQVIVTGRTVGMALLIGIGVTLISAIAPAIRAARVEPLAAINGVDSRQETNSKWPTYAALAAVVLAIGLLIVGFGDGISFTQRLATLIPGAIVLFVALAILSRFVAAPVMRGLSAPLQRNLAARMGASNAARNPRRTAITASALMIGLALIISIVTVGTSVRNALLNQFKTSTNAELFLSSDGFISIDGPSIGEAVAAAPEVDQTVDYAMASASLQGDTSYRITRFTVTPLEQFTRLFDVGISSGSTDGIGSNGVLLATEAAEKMGVSPGDTVTVTNSAGEKVELQLAATYDKTAIADQAIIDSKVANEMSLGAVFQGLAIDLAPGTNIESAQKAIEKATDGFPSHEIQTKADLEADFKRGFDQILRIISALLISSVLIAGLGVMNTLLLSVIERTREIGLLRAVGGTRRQIRSTIRWEALLTSTFGAILGIAVGTGLGYGVVMALPRDFVSTATPPISWMVLSLVFAVILGLLASVIPAFRASRMDVLKAIATDR
jgi:putative ABC transport system permease protein